MVVSIYFLGVFLVERMLDLYACIWTLTVAYETGVYLFTWFTVNSDQY